MCGFGPSCCTKAIEERLITAGLSTVSLDGKLGAMKETLIDLAEKYNSFYIDLINKSAFDLDDMFKKTYGELYMQESHIFSDLFRQLQLYYSGGRDLDIIKVFDKFFKILMQKMFSLLNAQYSFSNSYLKCVVEHMDSLKPFKDMPQKLSNQVKRTMVAARTFYEGLKVGRDFVTALQKVKVSQSCIRDHARMTVCLHCSGLNNVRPCSSYCSDVMSACYAPYHQLEFPWDNYLGQMRKVMERLEGPFHPVGIISPINVKISEAIMNYQDRSEDINNKVFMGCGEPTLTPRSKRSGPSEAGIPRASRSSEKIALGDLGQILQEVRDNLSASGDLFRNMTGAACEPLLVKIGRSSSNNTNSDDKCWNGTAKASYTKSPVVEDAEGGKTSEQAKDDQLIKQQINKLMDVTLKLTKSFEGLDVSKDEGASEGSGGNLDEDDMDGSGGSGLIDEEDDEDLFNGFSTVPPNRRHHGDVVLPPVRPHTQNVPHVPHMPRQPTTKSPHHRPPIFFNSAPSVGLGSYWQLVVYSALSLYSVLS